MVLDTAEKFWKIALLSFVKESPARSKKTFTKGIFIANS